MHGNIMNMSFKHQTQSQTLLTCISCKSFCHLAANCPYFSLSWVSSCCKRLQSFSFFLKSAAEALFLDLPLEDKSFLFIISANLLTACCFNSCSVFNLLPSFSISSLLDWAFESWSCSSLNRLLESSFSFRYWSTLFLSSLSLSFSRFIICSFAFSSWWCLATPSLYSSSFIVRSFSRSATVSSAIDLAKASLSPLARDNCNWCTKELRSSSNSCCNRIFSSSSSRSSCVCVL